MRVMVVTPYLPHRRVGHGGGTAVRDLVTWLARRHEVLVASLLRPGEEDLAGDVSALGARVETLPFRDAGVRGAGRLLLATDRLRAWLNARRSGYPLYVEKYCSPAAVRWLAGLVRDFAPDAVQFEYLQLSLLCRDLRYRLAEEQRPRLVLNSHELGSLPRERRAAVATGAARRRVGQEAAAWRRLQVDACGWADRILCVTEQDRELYAAMGGHGLVTVPLGMDTERIVPVWDPPPGGPGEHLFVGSFQHGPNRHAADLLVREIWPEVTRHLPGATLLLAGRGSRRFLAEAGPGAADGVRALGFVDDLTDLFRRCRLFLAPLPEGGGIKIKILEAMARGIPVVTTAVGAEGIADDGDEVLVLADHAPGPFAAAVRDAAADLDACRRRALRARAHIEAHYSWDAITGRLAEIYQGG